MKKEILKIENLTKVYNSEVEKITIFDNLNLSIYENDLVSIMGKSGSGKTTFLNILGLLDTKYEGVFKFLDVDSTKSLEDLRAKNIGFVFQFHHLLEEFTVLENVMLPALNIEFKNKLEIEKRAEELLDIVGLGHRKNYYPQNLSGGEKQRVAIARALINRPKILLADEPTGNLDEENSLKINELFLKLNKDLGQTIIIVTHSLELSKIANKRYKLEHKKLNNY